MHVCAYAWLLLAFVACSCFSRFRCMPCTYRLCLYHFFAPGEVICNADEETAFYFIVLRGAVTVEERQVCPPPPPPHATSHMRAVLCITRSAAVCAKGDACAHTLELHILHRLHSVSGCASFICTGVPPPPKSPPRLIQPYPPSCPAALLRALVDSRWILGWIAAC